jgi:hypothetical protein
MTNNPNHTSKRSQRRAKRGKYTGAPVLGKQARKALANLQRRQDAWERGGGANKTSGHAHTCPGSLTA